MTNVKLSVKPRVRLAVLLGIVAVFTLAMTVVGFCDTGVANEAVTQAFAGATDDIKATLAVIGASAVVIMGIFLAWKYGRKLFSTVAK